MKRAIRIALAALLLAPVGLTAACVSGSTSDSGKVVEVKSSKGQCRLKLKGDRPGWVTLAKIEPKEVEATHVRDGGEVCLKAFAGDGYSRAGNSITVTAHYTGSVGKPTKGRYSCVVVRAYSNGYNQAYQYRRGLPSDSYPPECADHEEGTTFDEVLTASIVPE